MSNENNAKNLKPSANDEAAQLATSTVDDNDSFAFVDVMDLDTGPPPALEVKVTPHHDVIGLNSEAATTQICATIKACDLPDDDSSRAAVDIVVALDVSGSMQIGSKLELCKKTLHLLSRELRPKDRFGLVTFSDEAVIEIPARKLAEHSKQMALDKINSLRTRGCTNISGAIGMAAQEIQAIESPNQVRSIFLLTDGLANRGVSDAAGIVEIAKGCLAHNEGDSRSPVTIHCFGYGSDHDAKLLRDISETTSGGTYYFVENDSDVASAFGDALGGILSVVAQNAVLTIRVPEDAAAAGVDVVDVHHDRTMKRDDGSFMVTVGDFYAEESRDVLFEVKLAKPSGVVSPGNTPLPHASVSLSYTDTIKKQLVNTDKIYAAIARPVGSEVSKANHHVAMQWLRILATKAMAEAKQMSIRGDLSGAKATITAALETIQSTEGAQSDPLVVQLITDLNGVLAGLANRTSYESYGAHFLDSRAQMHAQQRCAEAAVGTANVYRVSKKHATARKFFQG